MSDPEAPRTPPSHPHGALLVVAAVIAAFGLVVLVVRLLIVLGD